MQTKLQALVGQRTMGKKVLSSVTQQFHPQVYAQEKERCVEKLCMNVHSSVFHRHEEVETTPLPIS